MNWRLHSMRKILFTLLIVMTTGLISIVASAEESKLQMIPVQDLDVDAFVEKYNYDGGTSLPMTKDDPKNQKRIPSRLMMAPFSYRVPKDATIKRGKMNIGDGGFLSPIFMQDTLFTKKYTIQFTYANSSPELDLYEIEQIIYDKYGEDGWKPYSIRTVGRFWEKNTPERNISYGEFYGNCVFALITRVEPGSTKKDWWNKNILQGLELFRAEQPILYYGNGGAPYIAKVNVDYSNIVEAPERMRGQLNFYTSDSAIRFIPDAEYDRKYKNRQKDPVGMAIGAIIVKYMEMLADGSYIYYY